MLASVLFAGTPVVRHRYSGKDFYAKDPVNRRLGKERILYEGYSKVSTVCAYLSRILETVILRMCSDFLYQIEKQQPPFREIRVMFMFVPVR